MGIQANHDKKNKQKKKITPNNNSIRDGLQALLVSAACVAVVLSAAMDETKDKRSSKRGVGLGLFGASTGVGGWPSGAWPTSGAASALAASAAAAWPPASSGVGLAGWPLAGQDLGASAFPSPLGDPTNALAGAFHPGPSADFGLGKVRYV